MQQICGKSTYKNHLRSTYFPCKITSVEGGKWQWAFCARILPNRAQELKQNDVTSLRSIGISLRGENEIKREFSISWRERTNELRHGTDIDPVSRRGKERKLVEYSVVWRHEKRWQIQLSGRSSRFQTTLKSTCVFLIFCISNPSVLKINNNDNVAN